MFRRALIGSWLLALTALAAFADPESPPTPPINLLLISMDTTRADYLGCYGHPAIKTPNIDALATAGVRFERCDSAAPLTLPSHASLLTGVYPFVHGARDNGTFRLASGVETLAERLHESGYATMGCVGAFVLNREYGMGQGFDVFDDLRDAANGRAERSAEEVAAPVLDWMRANASRSFFIFAHFFDPHQPYNAPQRFVKQYPRGGYLAEIAYVDEQIGRLLDALRELKLADRTLVILTADHGEGLGAHGEATHGAFLYQTTLRVPLIMRLPEALPSGAVVSGVARTIDVAPTALALLGLPPFPAAQGASLLPLIRGESKLLGYSYAETFYPAFNFGFSHLRSISDGRWKLIHAPTPELYDLTADPDERDNLAAQQPDRVAELREALRDLIAEAPTVAGHETPTSAPIEADTEKLRSLGYLGGGGALSGDELSRFDPKGPNPADHARLMSLAIQGANLLTMRQPERAEQLLRSLFEEAPDLAGGFNWAHQSLGGALAMQGKFADAALSFQRAIDANPRDGDSYLKLARCYVNLGQSVDALAALNGAAEHLPNANEVFAWRAYAFVLKGDESSALEDWRRSQLAQAPTAPTTGAAATTSASSPNDAANTLSAIADSASSLMLFEVERAARRMALQHRPDDPAIIARLTWLLATCPTDAIRDGAEALRLGRLAVERGPQSMDAAYALVAALAETGDFDAAQLELKRLAELPNAKHANADRLSALKSAVDAKKPCRAPGWVE